MRQQELAAIDDSEAFDCAWIPTFFLTEEMARREMALSVSKTPTPCRAAASKNGAPAGFRASFKTSTGWMLRMSLLLNWKTIGRSSSDRPSSAMLALRLASDSMFVSSAATWLSATNTTPSTPFKTSFRVAL